jgi:NitT/TauT family transport system permease protein
MRHIALSWQAMGAALLAAIALFFLPLVETPAGGDPPAMKYTAALFLLIAVSIVVDSLKWSRLAAVLTLGVVVHVAAWLLMSNLSAGSGLARPAFYLVLAALWLLAWRLASLMSAIRPQTRLARALLGLVIPGLFGIWILLVWEAVVRGTGIPSVLLPPPSAIARRFASSLPVLAADVNQTIFKAVLVGYAVGCLSGFLAAIVADRFLFLRRGLLPIGNMVSALPIIGVAPIMVMWFGFDWHSKAAVVVIMTFFPMLVNTVAGLAASGHMERDLMRTYASGYWQTLAKLRLPAAMPFIFNALKINSTLALIGAIVAEFFGTPVVGMGFRISTEVGRMNVDMVWAEIAVAAIAGSVFYGVIALVERAVTFWHPSVRGG